MSLKYLAPPFLSLDILLSLSLSLSLIKLIALSFLLPLVIRILHETTPTERDEGGPRAVVLAPTRELCMQLEQQAQQIMKGW